MNEEQKDIGFKGENKRILPVDPTLLHILQEISALERSRGIFGLSISPKGGKVLTREVAKRVLDTLRGSVTFIDKLDEIPVAPSRPDPRFTRRR